MIRGIKSLITFVVVICFISTALIVGFGFPYKIILLKDVGNLEVAISMHLKANKIGRILNGGKIFSSYVGRISVERHNSKWVTDDKDLNAFSNLKESACSISDGVLSLSNSDSANPEQWNVLLELPENNKTTKMSYFSSYFEKDFDIDWSKSK